MPSKYHVELYAPDGDKVTDFRDSETVEDAWESVNNMGSRWYFYPYPVVIETNSDTIAGVIDSPMNPTELIGQPSKEFKTWLLANATELEELTK